MKNILLYLSLTALLLSCGKEDDLILLPGAQGWHKNQTIDVSGTSRNFHLYLPKNVTNAPIVILLHGNRSDSDELMGFTNLKAPYEAWVGIAQEENIILVVPNGTDGSSGHRGIDFVLNEHNANSSKVFAVGTSNGGHMAMRLAQEIPDKLKAFAAIVASNSINSKCTKSTLPISALFMNGTEDPINPYGGGKIKGNRGEVLSAQETTAYWVNRNQTDTSHTITDFTDTNTSDKSTLKKHLYVNGINNTEVAFYEVIGGGHTEPSIAQRYGGFFKDFIVGEQNGDIEMADEVWNFFKNK